MFWKGNKIMDYYLHTLSHHRYILSSTGIYRSRLCLYRRHYGDNGDYSFYIHQDLSLKELKSYQSIALKRQNHIQKIMHPPTN